VPTGDEAYPVCIQAQAPGMLITSGGIEGLDLLSVTRNTCGASLDPGATCTVSVTFTPSATGLRNGLVVVHDSAYGGGGGGHKVSLSGTGTQGQ